MASSTQGSGIRTGSIGRGFACMDPERQRETAADVIRTSPGRSPARPAKPASTDWMRVQPDRDTSMFEGSSSRRSR